MRAVVGNARGTRRQPSWRTTSVPNGGCAAHEPSLRRARPDTAELFSLHPICADAPHRVRRRLLAAGASRHRHRRPRTQPAWTGAMPVCREHARWRRRTEPGRQRSSTTGATRPGWCFRVPVTYVVACRRRDARCCGCRRASCVPRAREVAAVDASSSKPVRRSATGMYQNRRSSTSGAIGRPVTRSPQTISRAVWQPLVQHAMIGHVSQCARPCSCRTRLDRLRRDELPVARWRREDRQIAAPPSQLVEGHLRVADRRELAAKQRRRCTVRRG